jgi:hypothetical protein
VIIDDLNFKSVRFNPHEAQSILTVDANAVLPLAVSLQWLQAVSRRFKEVRQGLCGVQYSNLPHCSLANVRGDAAALAGKPQRLRVGVREAPDHFPMITLLVKNGKR